MARSRVECVGSEQSVHLWGAKGPSRGSRSHLPLVVRFTDAMPHFEAWTLDGVDQAAQIFERVVGTPRRGRRNSH